MSEFDKNVQKYFGLSETSGDIGIEIEMETVSPVNSGIFHPTWRAEHDGSLRGHGIEFVLRKPIYHKDVPDVMNDFRGKVSDNGIEILPSIRAGIHLHLNMQKYSLKEVLRFMMCYYPMETVLLNYCGEGRQGNLFCLRGRDAEYIFECITLAAQNNDIYMLDSNNLRYSSLNPMSLFKYGSLEFRALATTPTLEKIEDFADILIKIRDYSSKIEDCWTNISNISGLGPTEWMGNILGPDLMKKLEYPGMEKDIMKDLRNMQYACSVMSMKGI